MEPPLDNPYTSQETTWHKFPVLHPKIVDALLKQGFQSPTQIQSQTLMDYPQHNYFIIASMTVTIFFIFLF